MEGEIIRTRVPLSSVYVNPANYKVHPRAQLDELKASLCRFGQVEPAVVKKQATDSYLLVAHEGVTLAAKELYAEDPLLYHPLYDWAVVIVPVEWSEEQIEGYMVASNETMTKAETDDHKLFELLKRQHDGGYLLASMGVDEADYQMLLQERTELPFAWAGEDVSQPALTPVPTPLHPRQPEAKSKQAVEPIPLVTPSGPMADQEAWKLNQTPLRQMVLVTSPERYSYLLAAFARLREQEGLGSHADVVLFLLQQYLASHPTLAPEPNGGMPHVSD